MKKRNNVCMKSQYLLVLLFVLLPIFPPIYGLHADFLSKLKADPSLSKQVFVVVSTEKEFIRNEKQVTHKVFRCNNAPILDSLRNWLSGNESLSVFKQVTSTDCTVTGVNLRFERKKEDYELSRDIVKALLKSLLRFDSMSIPIIAACSSKPFPTKIEELRREITDLEKIVKEENRELTADEKKRLGDLKVHKEVVDIQNRIDTLQREKASTADKDELWKLETRIKILSNWKKEINKGALNKASGFLNADTRKLIEDTLELQRWRVDGTNLIRRKLRNVEDRSQNIIWKYCCQGTYEERKQK